MSSPSRLNPDKSEARKGLYKFHRSIPVFEQMNSKPPTLLHIQWCNSEGLALGLGDPSLVSTDSCTTLVKFYKFGFTKTGLLKIITGLRSLNTLLELISMLLLTPHASTSTFPRADERLKITCEQPLPHGVGGRPGTPSPPRLQKEPPQQQCQGLCCTHWCLGWTCLFETDCATKNDSLISCSQS